MLLVKVRRFYLKHTVFSYIFYITLSGIDTRCTDRWSIKNFQNKSIMGILYIFFRNRFAKNYQKHQNWYGLGFFMKILMPKGMDDCGSTKTKDIIWPIKINGPSLDDTFPLD